MKNFIFITILFILLFPSLVSGAYLTNSTHTLEFGLFSGAISEDSSKNYQLRHVVGAPAAFISGGNYSGNLGFLHEYGSKRNNNLFVNITSPSNSPCSELLSIAGTAGSTDIKFTISQVTIFLQRVSDNTYYNGSTWQSAKTPLICTGTYTWSYAISTGVFTAGGNYSITPMAYDASGGYIAGRKVTFIYVESTDPEESLISYPNPFNPEEEEATIEFIAETQKVIIIKIFDIKMNIVKKYKIFGHPGINNIKWDGKNEFDNFVNSGTYYIIFNVEGEKPVTKMMSIRR
ncbi:MAG: hypothetical protein KAS39_03965 [Actinomycetia bacterium]|nr:hypothetical protein [Actinomycetes bacterium]